MTTLQLLDTDGTFTHIAISGRLDIAGVGLIEDRFVIAATSVRKPALIDISGVTFIGSLGVGMFVGVVKTLKLHGAPVVLYRPTEEIERIFDLAGMKPILPIAHDLDRARVLLLASVDRPKKGDLS